MIEEIPFTEGIKKTKREHPGYIEYLNVVKTGYTSMPCVFGQWQYYYENEKGIIDAVLLPNYLRDGIDIWEIWSDEKLFEDVERFNTLEQVEERVKEILLKND